MSESFLSPEEQDIAARLQNYNRRIRTMRAASSDLTPEELTADGMKTCARCTDD